MGGFSKAYAMTGWRLGWLAAPADICGAVRKVHQYGIMSAPTAAQYAGLAALLHGEADVQQMVNEYDQRRQVLVAGLRRIGLPTFEPRGAFYVFPDIRSTGLSSADFCERLLTEEHVAVIPGDVFGPSGAGFVRLCYASSMHNIETALERIERFVGRIA
jgi:aminotransferase